MDSVCIFVSVWRLGLNWFWWCEQDLCSCLYVCIYCVTLFVGFDGQISPASGLVSILKKRVNTDAVNTPNRSEPVPKKGFAQRRVRFKVPDDSYDNGMCLSQPCKLKTKKIASLWSRCPDLFFSFPWTSENKRGHAVIWFSEFSCKLSGASGSKSCFLSIMRTLLRVLQSLTWCRIGQGLDYFKNT